MSLLLCVTKHSTYQNICNVLSLLEAPVPTIPINLAISYNIWLFWKSTNNIDLHRFPWVQFPNWPRQLSTSLQNSKLELILMYHVIRAHTESVQVFDIFTTGPYMIKLNGIYNQNQPGSGLGCFGRHQLKVLGALLIVYSFCLIVTSMVSISGNKLRGMLLHAKRHSLPVRTRKAPLRYLSAPKLKSRFHSGTGAGLFTGPAWVLLDPSKAAWVQPWKTEKKKLLPHKESRKKCPSLLFPCVVIDLQALIQAPY